MKSAGKARNDGLYRHIRTSKEIIRNLLNDLNKRKKVIVIKNSSHEHVKEEKYEIVFDDVKYINVKTNESYREQQVEIELKSTVETRINMKGLTNDLERKIPNMQSISESKYHRAVDRVLISAT